MKNKPKILFFAPILEYPPKGGPQLSVINAIKVLNRVSILTIATSVNKSFHDKKTIQFLEENSTEIIYTPSSHIFTKKFLLIKHATKIKRILNPLSCFLDSLFILKKLIQNQIKVVWIDRVIEHAFFVFFYIKILTFKTKIVADTETVYSDFILRETPFIKNKFRFFYVFLRGRFAQFQEKFMIKNADVITAVSELDCNHYQKKTTKKQKVKLFSNVVDFEDYKHVDDIDIKKPYLILMGSFGHQNSPMDRAAKWLVNKIMPLVWSEKPKVNVCIIGRNADLTQSNLSSERVIVIGTVTDMLPYLKNAAASLVPLIYESGTRFKIIESGAASIPCISTTLGAEGLDITNGKNILIADNAKDFASSIIKILSNKKLSKTLSAELHELVKKNYSLDKQTKEGQDIIDYVAGDINE